MSDPIFGRIGHRHRHQAVVTSKRHHHPKHAASPKRLNVKEDGSDMTSVPVQNVRVGLEVMSMANALGHNSALFISLEGCPYCDHFKGAWNEACDGKSPILWLHCAIHKMNEARMHLGAVSFPCLVANGRIHQEESGANTSEMTAKQVVAFASKRSDERSSIDFLEDEEEQKFPVDHQDLLSEHSDESSDAASEAISSDHGESETGSCGEEDEAVESFGSESMMEDDDTDQKDGFQYTALPTDVASASQTQPLMICFYWKQCGGCNRFKPEWNSLVQQAMDDTPSVTFAVVNIEEDQDLFQKTGSETVPHIQLHIGGPDVHTSGPQSANQLWDWVRRAVL